MMGGEQEGGGKKICIFRERSGDKSRKDEERERERRHWSLPVGKEKERKKEGERRENRNETGVRRRQERKGRTYLPG